MLQGARPTKYSPCNILWCCDLQDPTGTPAGAPAGAFCPHDSTVLRDTASILMWFVWSFCKNSCEADQLYCSPTWGLSLLQLAPTANQFLTSKSAGLGPWDWARSCLVHLQLFYLALIFHLLLYLTWECLRFFFYQSIENVRRCCIF